MSHCRSTAQLDYRSRSGACQQPGKVGGTFPKYKSAVTKDKGKRYMYYVTVLVACLCSAACMWSVLKVGNEKCWYGTLSIFPSLSSLPCPSFLFPLPFPPFLLYPFPFPGSPPPNPATRSGEHYELPRQVWPGDKLFLVHSELKTTLPVIVLLQKFSDDQVCIVIHIGTVTYQYDISQKRNGVMVSSRPRKCQYGIPSHFQPFMWCFLVLDLDTCCTSHTLCWRNEEQF